MTKSRTRKKSSTKRSRKRGKAPARVPPAFYERVTKATEPASGTMGGEFAEAVTRGPDRAARLRQFLKQYDPGDGDYEDAFHARRVRAAQFELMRLEYLARHIAAGDRLLARLQEVAG
jgi:hypothetical protein